MESPKANLKLSIDPQVKEEAERILSAIGVSPETVVNLLYRQIIINKGLPFPLISVPSVKPAEVPRPQNDWPF